MKVLLLNGSPNEHGCTYTALCEVARALEESGVETETLWIGNRAVRGCIGCGGCAKNGRRRCVFEDDLVNAALDRMQATATVWWSVRRFITRPRAAASPLFWIACSTPAAASFARRSARQFAARAARAQRPRSISFPNTSPSAACRLRPASIGRWCTETRRKTFSRTRKACRSCACWGEIWRI